MMMMMMVMMMMMAMAMAVLVVLVVVMLCEDQTYLDFSSFRDILVFVDEPQFVEQRTPPLGDRGG
jgi:hypothetical protein